MDKKTEAQRSQIPCQKSGNERPAGLAAWDTGCVLNKTVFYHLFECSEFPRNICFTQEVGAVCTVI